MADINKKPAKAAAGAFETVEQTTKQQFDVMKQFAEFPKLEVPAAYRDLAEKGISQAKQNYERLRTASEEASDLLETTYNTALRGMSEYGQKVIEAFRMNANAQFDFTRDLLGTKSVSEAVELSSAHTRKQFETVTAQSKELATLAQKISTEATQPIKTGFDKALRAVA
jgi:phasin